HRRHCHPAGREQRLTSQRCRRRADQSACAVGYFARREQVGVPGFEGKARRLSYCGLFTHWPASPTMPTGTAPERLTFCTLGPAATIVVSCRIGSTVDMFHSRGSTALITSLMSLLPSRAASMFDWMLRSQMPVMFDGACTSAPFSGAGL